MRKILSDFFQTGVRNVKPLIFSLLPAVLLLFTSEIILRAADFRYSDTPLLLLSRAEQASNLSFSRYVQGTADDHFVKDRNMIWVLKPPFEDRYPKEKQPGVKRIITLGCSCTQGCAGDGTQSYPKLMGEILETRLPKHYEVLNAGAGGYSSFQGLQLLTHTVAKYKPDLVTIFFGWNDHWIAEIPDHLLKVKADWELDLINFLEQFRTYQAFHWLIASGTGKIRKTRKEQDGVFDFRVPIETYQKNLNAMADFCQSKGIRPVLITAPFKASQWRGPTQYFPNPIEDLSRVHEAYNDIVRQVGEARKVPVIDLAEAFSELEKNYPGNYFSDGIHFSPLGCQMAAMLIVERMKQLSLLEPS